ncbi:tlp-like protein [Peridroma alphabaculovirus]|uniref:Tlp-like protein n=1 Tax=Peridroma alphabaculovirus TaxID=1346829 RepID=A0A068LMN3_9ABAC|nr:tlp-like protein [Peridroma alphabaculovirus]AIE47796.1 tlp-like protein [Peridroma alphabaculovirus]
MATNSSGTVDISAHVTLDRDANKNVLSFIVREEYHLKKLAVGAYSLNILDTQLLNNLSERHNCTTVACGDYVIVHNFTENSNKINVILFNIKPTVLKKDVCIFKIMYNDTTDKNAPVESIAVEEQHSNSQLFQSAFAHESDDDASSCSDDDASSATATDDLSAQPVPAKRQKLDDEQADQV